MRISHDKIKSYKPRLDRVSMQLTFEPVIDPLYNRAKEEYSSGIENLAISHNTPDKEFNHESSVNLQRYHFGVCVSILRELYSQKKVEYLDGMPFPVQVVFSFNEGELEDLALSLSELYFPEESERIKFLERKRKVYTICKKSHKFDIKMSKVKW